MASAALENEPNMHFLRITDLEIIYDIFAEIIGLHLWYNQSVDLCLFGLRWFCEDQIQWIRIHPQHVSKIVTLYFDFMLNLPDINNYLFLFFFLKKGLTGTTCLKEENTPPHKEKKWRCAHTIHATSNLPVLCTVDTTCARLWGSSVGIQQIPNW